MKKLPFPMIFLALSLLPPLFSVSRAFGEEGAWEGNLNLALGWKELGAEWDPTDGQVVVGLQGDLKPPRWPVSVVLAANRIGIDQQQSVGLDSEGDTDEFDLGVKKTFQPFSDAHFFLAAGLTYVNAEAQGRTAYSILGVKNPPSTAPVLTDKDAALGAWFSGGFFTSWKGHFNFGPYFKYTKAEVSLFGKDTQAGGMQGGLLFGWHFD